MSQEDSCNINIGENMKVKYKHSDEDYDNTDVDSDYTAQNKRIENRVSLELNFDYRLIIVEIIPPKSIILGNSFFFLRLVQFLDSINIPQKSQSIGLSRRHTL